MRSKTRLYRAVYHVLGAFYPVLRQLAPNLVTTTENVGRAMIEVAADGYPRHIVTSSEINFLAKVGTDRESANAAATRAQGESP